VSRHELAARDTYPGAKVAVGWDPPLRTYFAVVRLIDDDDEPFLWIGTGWGEIEHPEYVIEAVEKYALVTIDTYSTLCADREADR
jgi:hypothetical protein